MANLKESEILAALKTVTHPELSQNPVEAGMISGITIEDGAVLFLIEVDPAKGAAMEELRQSCERTVQAIKGVSKVTAVLTAERQMPAGPTLQARKKANPNTGGAGLIDLPNVKYIIAVASGKGGVGKSTVAANLAVALSQLGQKIGLLDADIYGPSQPRMMGIADQKPHQDGNKLIPLDAHGLKVMSMGFLVEEAAPMIWRGPMVQSAIQQMLRDVDWGTLDILVIDMPPGTGDAQLTLAQKVALSGAVIVSTPQDIALIDARKGLNMFKKTAVPVLGIIENMSYFCCPECGHQSDIFGHGGAKVESENLNVPFLGEIPLGLDIRHYADSGTPICAALPESAYTQSYIEIAANVLGQLDQNVDNKPAPLIKFH